MTQLFTASSATLSQSSAAQKCSEGSVAIGNFDGLHRGHIALLRTFKEQRLPRPWVVLTFEPHPRRFFAPDEPPFRLSSSAQKRRWLEEQGFDALLVLTFEQSLAALTANDFVETFLIQALKARHIVVGENFAFGHKRQGTLATLRAFEASGAFCLHSVPLSAYLLNEGEGEGAESYSSSRAREAVRAGHLDTARAVLGRSFEIEGVVQKGKGLGRKLGFPTANIDPKDYCQPRFGVYDVHVIRDGVQLDAVASFGKRPTLAAELEALLELHFFDCCEALYGETLRVDFERFQRPEHRYESLSALQAQITEDVASSKRYFQERASSEVSSCSPARSSSHSSPHSSSRSSWRSRGEAVRKAAS